MLMNHVFLLKKKNEIGFCEAVKVDVSRLKEANFPASITKTLALLSVLFEDFGVAVELHETEKKLKTLKWHFQLGIRFYSMTLLNLRRDFWRRSLIHSKRNV